MISEQELRTAIEDKQFVLHYLPVVNLDNSKLVGVEALLRLPTGNKEFLLPAEFLPVAEQSGQIIELGYAVFTMACEQIKVWQGAGLPPLTIGINISSAQCRDPDLEKTYRSILADMSVDPDLFMFELSDTVFIDNPNALEALQGMRSIGVQVALDNYGCGTSNAEDLPEFPIDAIKIDRSVVKVIEESEDARQLIASVIQYTQGPGFIVISEGVETGEQFDILEEIGCQYVQGFFFDGPVPPGQIPALVGG